MTDQRIFDHKNTRQQWQTKPDALGRQATGTDPAAHTDEYTETEEYLAKMLADYEELMKQPYLTGKDLLEAGVKAGPLMGEALDYAHKLRLAGLSKEEQFRQTMAFIRIQNKSRS